MFKKIRKWYFKIYHLFKLLGIFILIIPCMVKAEEIPSQYIEIPYLENTTGDEYIDTEINLNFNSVIYYDFEASTVGQLFGDMTTPGRQYALRMVNDKFYVEVFGRYNRKGVSSLNTRYDLKMTTGGLWNGETQIITYAIPDSTINTSNIYLFKTKAQDSIKGAIQKVYSAKLYTNANTMVADYIPVYDKENKKYGMYDKVRNRFFENSGSGEFKTSDEWTPPSDGGNTPSGDDVYSSFIDLYIEKIQYLVNGTRENKYLMTMVGIIFGWITLEMFIKILHLKEGRHR